MHEILFGRANEHLDRIGVELSSGYTEAIVDSLEDAHAAITLWRAFCTDPEQFKLCELSSTIHQTAILIAKMRTVMQLLQMLKDDHREHPHHV